MTTKKRGLGKGLDALLNPRSVKELDAGEHGDELTMLAVDLMQRGQYQPRKEIDKDALQELADSIQSQGLIQPILVRALPGKTTKYEIVAGERRWRAAQLAGLHEVPVVIRDIDDHAAMSMALIENIQREDLNPLEEAEALQRLIKEFEMTHEAVAESVGRSRSAVSNLLRLLELEGKVKAFLAGGEIEMGHARCLLSLPKTKQYDLAKTIVNQGLSVRAAEALVRAEDAPKNTKARKVKADPNIQTLEDELSDKIGAAVSIKHSAQGKGSLTIKYHSLDELDGILKRIK